MYIRRPSDGRDSDIDTICVLNIDALLGRNYTDKLVDSGEQSLRDVVKMGSRSLLEVDKLWACQRDLQNRCFGGVRSCLLYTSPSPRDGLLSRMPSSA